MQTLPSVLPPTEGGLHSTQIMSGQNYVKAWAITVILTAFIGGVASQYSIKALDEATRIQCKNHDWPIATDRIHKDWCVDNGYKI